MHDLELQKLRTSHQKWREDLVVGSKVDVLVKEGRSQNSLWMQGEITAISGDTIHVEFPLSKSDLDGHIDRWSSEVQPFESKTKSDYEWRR